MKKLVIWDFDGVIADTEKLWIEGRMELLADYYGVKWDFNTTMNYLGGMSDKDKNNVLKNLGIYTDDEFWEKIVKIDKEKIKKGFALTDYIENIFKNKNFEQCIATGGVYEKTKLKIKKVDIEKYFPDEKVFTVDLVEKGKPEPDIFLLAAEKMGYKEEDCFVVEDSVAGLTAVLKTKMNPIAFVKYDNKQIINKIKEMGIKNIFDDMRDIEKFLLKNIKQ